MLPAQHRMRRSSDYALVRRAGRTARRGSLTVSVLGLPDSAAPTRVGFIVGKQAGSAVVRNRVRRRLRHLMARQVTRLPPGQLVVVRALPTAAGVDHASLDRQLHAAVDAAARPRPPADVGAG